jgi:ribonuclease P protein component
LKEVVTTGRAVYESPFKLVGKKMELPGGAPAQIAFAVPRRNMRSAVHRNRMRRRMRESWRLNRQPFVDRLKGSNTSCAWLFVYQGKSPLSFSLTQVKITRLLDRWLNEHG